MASQTPEQQILPRSFHGSGARALTKSAKRFTPYRSAVASRSRKVTQSVRSRQPLTPGGARRRGQTTPDSDVTQELTNKTWRVYRASPYYNLSYRPAHLREYGRALALSIEAESNKGLVVSGGSEVSGSKLVEFTCITGLRSNNDDRNAVKIVVKNKAGSTDSSTGKVAPPVLTAYLCCVEVTGSVSSSVSKDFVYLPLLLVKSTVFLNKVLTEFLQKRFDCVIRDLTLSTTDMHWLFTINAGYVPDKLESKPAELMYVIGDEIKGINKITFSIDAKNCQELIQSVCEEGSEDLNQHQKDRVIQALEQHFHEHFRLNLNNLKLQRIATAVSVVGAEGRLKMYSSKHVLQILGFLTTLCCEHFEKVTGIQNT